MSSGERIEVSVTGVKRLTVTLEARFSEEEARVLRERVGEGNIKSEISRAVTACLVDLCRPEDENGS